MLAKDQTATHDREYRARVLLVEAAFRNFSGILIECDEDLRSFEWGALDEARLPHGEIPIRLLVQIISGIRQRLLQSCPEIAAQRLGIVRDL